MDSKIVGKELWKVLRPFLKEAGWSSFAGRTARRISDTRVDVISFQSFNSYLAAAISATTYSFSVRLGCFFPAIPNFGIKVKNGVAMPEEYQCQLRSTLHRKFAQPECARTDVFYIDPGGKYLSSVVEGVRHGIATEGLSWFRRFSDMWEVLRTLQEDDEVNDGTWGFGAKSNPARNLYTGYIALSLGKIQIARDRLTQAARSPSYATFHQRIEKDLSNLQ